MLPKSNPARAALADTLAVQLGRRHSGLVVAFHQAVADQLGVNATDLKALDLATVHGSTTAGQVAETTAAALRERNGSGRQLLEQTGPTLGRGRPLRTAPSKSPASTSRWPKTCANSHTNSAPTSSRRSIATSPAVTASSNDTPSNSAANPHNPTATGTGLDKRLPKIVAGQRWCCGTWAAAPTLLVVLPESGCCWVDWVGGCGEDLGPCPEQGRAAVDRCDLAAVPVGDGTHVRPVPTWRVGWELRGRRTYHQCSPL